MPAFPSCIHCVRIHHWFLVRYHFPRILQCIFSIELFLSFWMSHLLFGLYFQVAIRCKESVSSNYLLRTICGSCSIGFWVSFTVGPWSCPRYIEDFAFYYLLSIFIISACTFNFFSFDEGYYLTKASSNPGAGDVLMGFLGSVILSFAFSMFKQRKVIFVTLHEMRDFPLTIICLLEQSNEFCWLQVRN